MVDSAPAPRPSRVLVIDPRVSGRNALRFALGPEPMLTVAADTADVAGALRLVAAGSDFDVVALDARAARPDAKAAIAALALPVVLMRIENGPGFARLAIEAGAVGQARKDDLESIVAALTAAVA